MKTIGLGALVIAGVIITVILAIQFFGLLYIVCNNMFTLSHIPNTLEHRFDYGFKGFFSIVFIAGVLALCWIVGNCIVI
jgi:hypothetical protein